MRRAKGVRREFLRVLDDRYGMAEVIQRFHRVHVDTNAFFSQQFDEFRVAAPAFMSRHIKGNNPLLSKLHKRLINRRALLNVEIH